jgi:hypothetical protein
LNELKIVSHRRILLDEEEENICDMNERWKIWKPYTPIAKHAQVLNNKNDLDNFLSNCHSSMISERSEKKGEG